MRYHYKNTVYLKFQEEKYTLYVRILSLRFQVSLWFCKKVFTNPKNCSITCITVAKHIVLQENIWLEEKIVHMTTSKRAAHDKRLSP